MPALATQWKRLPRAQQRLALVFCSVLGLWVMDLTALRPLRLRLSRLNREARELEQRLLEAMVASAQAEAVEQAFTAYQPYLATATNSDAEIAGVLTEVETAVRDAGMVLMNLRPDAGGDAVRVTVETESSPSQLVQLLDRVQRSSRLLRVTQLSLRVVEGRILRASIVISKLLVAP